MSAITDQSPFMGPNLLSSAEKRIAWGAGRTYSEAVGTLTAPARGPGQFDIFQRREGEAPDPFHERITEKYGLSVSQVFSLSKQGVPLYAQRRFQRRKRERIESRVRADRMALTSQSVSGQSAYRARPGGSIGGPSAAGGGGALTGGASE